MSLYLYFSFSLSPLLLLLSFPLFLPLSFICSLSHTQTLSFSLSFFLSFFLFLSFLISFSIYFLTYLSIYLLTYLSIYLILPHPQPHPTLLIVRTTTLARPFFFTEIEILSSAPSSSVRNISR